MSVCDSGVGALSFPIGTVKAVRALNRQRIMEIKAERLANGAIMAGVGGGQLGHANDTDATCGAARVNIYRLRAGNNGL